MKLSEVLELMLLTGAYSNAGYYMCHALEYEKLKEYTPLVMDMVHSFGSPCHCSLIGAVCHYYRRKGLVNLLDEMLEDADAWGTQFYCWWVFDLKRKGL